MKKKDFFCMWRKKRNKHRCYLLFLSIFFLLGYGMTLAGKGGKESKRAKQKKVQIDAPSRKLCQFTEKKTFQKKSSKKREQQASVKCKVRGKSLLSPSAWVLPSLIRERLGIPSLSILQQESALSMEWSNPLP